MNPMLTALLEFIRPSKYRSWTRPARPGDLAELRVKLLREVEEYAQALADGDLVEVLDALADIGYILAGSVINHGLHGLYDEAFAEIHRSNMAELVDGKVLRREEARS